MLKVLYGGTPECSARVLEAILRGSAEGGVRGVAAYKVTGVLTRPPAPRGRSGKPEPSHVAKRAAAWNEARGDDIAIFTPEHLGAASREELRRAGADIFVCFAYGRILGPKALSLFRFGGVNLHPSLLPRYRGASPVQEAILNGDEETGVSVQKMAVGMDEGDIFFQRRVKLNGTETAEQVLNELAALGGEYIIKLLGSVASTGRVPPAVPQTGEASYCSVIRKEDGLIHWGESAAHIDRQIRAYTPWPACYTFAGGTRLRILRARPLPPFAAADIIAARAGTGAAPGTVLECDRERGILIQTGDGILAVTELQWQAKKAMDYKSFINGTRSFAGTVLGETNE